MTESNMPSGLWALDLSKNPPTMPDFGSQRVDLALVALFLLFVAFWVWQRQRVRPLG